jgi:hypothetical protein
VRTSWEQSRSEVPDTRRRHAGAPRSPHRTEGETR